MRSPSIKIALSAIFGVLIFLVELIPPPMSRLLQIFTALFITMAALAIRRPGGATYACLIAGLLDAFYTGLPVAFVLFIVRGVTFDLALLFFKVRNSHSSIRAFTSSILSSFITGFVAYLTLVEWLKIIIMPFEIFALFIGASTILSGIGAVIGLKLWQRLRLK